MYPVSLGLGSRRCLVVGGGGVALRKVEGLILEGALITVVAPKINDALKGIAADSGVVIHEREYAEGEAAGYSLVFAATDNRSVNRRVFEDANQANVWVNVADDPELCTFHLPARVKRGALQMAVASAGEAPFVVRRMRQLLERRFGDEWSEWVKAASRFRSSVLAEDMDASDKEVLFDTFFAETVDQEKLVARVPSAEEEAAWLASKKKSVTSQSKSPPAETKEPSKKGMVSLVGAGPGDPGLMTLRGKQRLLAADAVVCDRLAAPALPCDLPAHVEIRFVGKEAGYHPVPQKEINALLVRLAKEGKRVVRLKGGDPYVFGRGGEEATVLKEAGIPFEIVPCVTAAVAVPAYAGIPVTFRREVVRVTMVTAHEAVKSGGPQVRWDLIAGDPHAMILGYMGVTSLPNVLRQLMEAGMEPQTPAALIERGTTSAQRTVVSTVANLQEDVKKASLGPPALFVIGPTIKHADVLDWFTKRPLFGKRIVVFSALREIIEELQLGGAEIVEIPERITPAARMVMGVLPLHGCIFENEEQVETLEDERDGLNWAGKSVAWCLNERAEKRARSLNWPQIYRIPKLDNAAQLVSIISDLCDESDK